MKTSTTILTASSLQDIDGGKPALAINHALRQCALDVADRPADKTNRKVKVLIELSPHLDPETATLDTVDISFKVKSELPAMRSVAYPMLPHKEGTLTFQPDSPLDPRQSGFVFDGDGSGDVVNTETGEVSPKGD